MAYSKLIVNPINRIIAVRNLVAVAALVARSICLDRVRLSVSSRHAERSSVCMCVTHRRREFDSANSRARNRARGSTLNYAGRDTPEIERFGRLRARARVCRQGKKPTGTSEPKKKNDFTDEINESKIPRGLTAPGVIGFSPGLCRD